MLIPFADFPLRPARNPGENLIGYVYRFYWENGHEVPMELCRTLRYLLLGERLSGAFSHLEAVMGELGMAERDWWINRRLDAPNPSGSGPKWRHFYYTPIRYCPACLKKFGFHAEIWMLPLVWACPIHQCLLLSRCAVCDQSLPWSALKPGWHCRCGAELGTAQAVHPARSWAVRFAALIQHGMDHVSSMSDQDGHTVQTGVGGRDSVYAIYDFIERAYTLRRQLTRRSKRNGVSRRFPTSKSTPHVPGIWEVRFLLGDACVLERALRSLLKMAFRQKHSMLVVLGKDGPSAWVMSAIDGLQKNPCTEAIHSQAIRLLQELHVGIHDCAEVHADIYFHPRYFGINLQPYLVVFAQWWYTFSNQVSVLEPEMRLNWGLSLHGLGDRIEWVAEIMNSLLEAAWYGKNVERYSKLKTRWNLPERLQRKLDPSEVLSQVGGYLAGLQPSELAFVLDLLMDGVMESSLCQ